MTEYQRDHKRWAIEDFAVGLDLAIVCNLCLLMAAAWREFWLLFALPVPVAAAFSYLALRSSLRHWRLSK